MNKESKISSIVNKMKTLKYYKPTPWLINGFLQTYWGMFYKGHKNFKPIREDIDFPDGGQVTIEHFVLETTKETAPILFMIHTAGGSSREACTSFAANNFMKKGYRVIICSCRGCNGSKLKTKRLYDGSNCQDTHIIVEYISKKYPQAKYKFLFGFSMGSMITTRYSTFYDDLDGIIGISHGIDIRRADLILFKGWKSFTLGKAVLQGYTKRIMKSNLYSDEEKKSISKIKTISEFNNLVTAKNLGLNNSDEFYDLINLYGKPAKAKVPTLILNSADDPFSKEEYIDKKELEDKSNQNLALILTKEGGHVSFAEGIDGKGSYAEDVAEEFFNILMKRD